MTFTSHASFLGTSRWYIAAKWKISVILFVNSLYNLDSKPKLGLVISPAIVSTLSFRIGSLFISSSAFSLIDFRTNAYILIDSFCVIISLISHLPIKPGKPVKKPF